ncbi:MAG: trypsin-like peptidase domain-containing protein [Chloroflexota bacterium]|nr:trypsin-like peptidase domain-containing protein [Chloroflexota bacterium]
MQLKRLLGWLTVLALVLTLTLTHTVSISVGHGPSAAAAPITSTGSGIDTEQIAAQVDPAVVTVINNQQAQPTRRTARSLIPSFPGGKGSNPSGNATTPSTSGNAAVPTGLGSGVIFDNQGDILTNNHVVEGATSLSVKLADGTQLDATLVGRDPSQDVAVVKIDPARAPAIATLGDSNTVKLGQPVVAIGSPETLANTVTAGIVSGTNRQIDTYAGLIQTDTAINPGNSGGPLVNAQGQVIGLNTLGLASQGDQGLNFAIPINTAKQVAQSVMSKGNGAVVNSRSYLGVSVDALSTTKGASVSKVETGTPAEQAGLQAGDVITAVNGTTLDSTTTLGSMLSTLKPGDTVTLTVDRNGSTQTLTATLAAYPTSSNTSTTP